MSLTDHQFPIIASVNDIPSILGDAKHPNGALMSKKYNDLITELVAMFTALPTSTDELTEGATNKYYADTLARLAISVLGNGSYNSSTGEITIDSPTATIDHISKTNTVGLVDTYTVWEDAGETTSLGTFDVTNGNSLGDANLLVLVTQASNPSLEAGKIKIYNQNNEFFLLTEQGHKEKIITQLDTPVSTTNPYAINLVFALDGNEGHHDGINTYPDKVATGHTITELGSPNSTQGFFFTGTGSYFLDGDEGIRVDQGTAWNFGLNSFTFEVIFWGSFQEDRSCVIFTLAPTGNYTGSINLWLDRFGGVELGLNGNFYNIPVNTINQWCHVAFCGDGTDIKVFINGKLSHTESQFSINLSDGYASIGCMPDRTYGLRGFLDLFAVSNISRYIGDFTFDLRDILI